MEKSTPLTSEQQIKIAKIAKKFHLKLVILFGSFSSGKNRADSDMDIAVLGLNIASFDDQLCLTNEFSQIFQSNVDLTVINSANPLLSFQISKNAVLLFGSQQEFMKFKLYAFHMFNDYAPYFQMEKNLNKKIINAYANR
ncbi:MAG: nucleotidyltransferase domain-containing protein [Parcubacteria group bacterium]|jgi:predicted nucleotidyltransferase